MSSEEEVGRIFQSLLAPITQDAGRLIPVVMPHCTPLAIITSSMNVPLAGCIPLTPPLESEVKDSFFATGEFDDNAFIRRCAFLSTNAVEEAPAEEEQPDSFAPEEAPAPAVTVAGATAGSQITATPKHAADRHDDTITVSDVAIVLPERHTASQRGGFFSCFACGN